MTVIEARVTHDLLPEWLVEVREHQSNAVEEIIALFEEVDMVIVDAPTGSGKSLLGELVRREMDVRGLYVCTDKALQGQFVGDFSYAAEIKGRSNYPTELVAGKTADDCGGELCIMCESKGSCPYIMAKNLAMSSDLAVLNTSYLLTEANGGNTAFGGAKRRELVILDEADLLEHGLLSFVGYEVPQWIWSMVNLKVLKKAVRKPTIAKWLDDAASQVAAVVDRRGDGLDPKIKRNLGWFVAETRRVARELRADTEEEEDSGQWIRSYDTKTLKLLPLKVAAYGNRYLWRHGRKFLLMSATVIDAEQMVDELGYTGTWAKVEVPMTFPVESRPIVYMPVASVTYATMKEPATVEAVAVAIRNIIRAHPDQRILVHTGSYHWNEKIRERLEEGLRGTARTYAGHLYTYTESKGKEATLREYLADPQGVLLAPSMERGVDLPGDACRVQVIAKVPFPSLGDKRVSGRMRLEGGERWYAVQTVREIVQMTGRGVRSDTDHAVTYVIDGQFGRVYGRNRALFPPYWRDAVDMTQPMGWLLEGLDR